MKRTIFLLATDLAVLSVLSMAVQVLVVDRILTAQELDLETLLVFAAVAGSSHFPAWKSASGHCAV